MLADLFTACRESVGNIVWIVLQLLGNNEQQSTLGHQIEEVGAGAFPPFHKKQSLNIY